MRKRKFATGRECETLLEAALDKTLPLTITKQSGNNWHVYKTNILLLQDRRMVIAMPMPQKGCSPMEPAANQEIAITFKKGYNKCLFVTRIISQSQFEVEPGTLVPVLVVYRPEQIEKIQRRAYDRTNVPKGEEIIVKYWSVDNPQDKFSSPLTNISAGGLGLSSPIADIPIWENDQQCEVQFVALPGQEAIIAHARYRHSTDSDQDGIASLGFQFIGLEITEQGRNTLRRLGRIVTIFERRNYTPKHSRR